MEGTAATTGSALVVPGTGEVVDRGDEVACARAYDGLLKLEAQLIAAKRALEDAIVERAAVLGVTEIALPGTRLVARVESTPRRTYDAHRLEELLREAGMPEQRIREIVVEEVGYKVVATEAKKAARANAAYARAVDETRIETPSRPTVRIRRR